MREIILYFALKYNGDFQLIYNAFKNKERVDDELFKELKNQLQCEYITIIDDDYPAPLKQIDCPPFVLFYYGDLSLTKQKMISIVGMREPDEYGKQATKLFASELSHEYVIVSGMAKGVDAISHNSAINAGGKTIAVLGTGIDDIYPKNNAYLYHRLKQDYLVMSEYPFNQGFKPDNFKYRNRIVAGLGQSVLVTQANIKSGTMVTVGFALEYGKIIYAIPSRITDPSGTNYLISQGATLVHHPSDILNDEKTF